jgi:hypothetical protein
MTHYEKEIYHHCKARAMCGCGPEFLSRYNGLELTIARFGHRAGWLERIRLSAADARRCKPTLPAWLNEVTL